MIVKDNINISFDTFIKYIKSLRAGHDNRLVIKKDPLENTRRKYILDRNVLMHKIDNKGRSKKKI